MAIARPMMLGDEAFDAPPQVLNNADSAFATPAAPASVSTDEGMFGTTPTYATRRSGGAGKKIAMIAIPLAVAAVAAGLLINSPRNQSVVADQPVAANGTPAQAGVAAVTPAAPAQVAEASPPLTTTTPLVATPEVTRPAAVTPARGAATRVRPAPRRAVTESTTTAPSAGANATDTSARVAAPPPAIDAPPPVLTVPAPTTPPIAPQPTTPPQ